ncbi:hypothetical protein ACFC0W_30655, partial [Actinacidiphila glaucinigra]
VLGLARLRGASLAEVDAAAALQHRVDRKYLLAVLVDEVDFVRETTRVSVRYRGDSPLGWGLPDDGAGPVAGRGGQDGLLESRLV